MQGVVMSLSTSSIQISNLSFKKITFCKSLLTSCLCCFLFFKSEEIHEDIILKSENYQKPSQISLCVYLRLAFSAHSILKEKTCFFMNMVFDESYMYCKPKTTNFVCLKFLVHFQNSLCFLLSFKYSFM